MKKESCFSFESIPQINKILDERKKNNKYSVIFIKNYLINGLGVNWLNSLINLIKTSNKKHVIKFYIDCGYDYGLSISLMYADIDYIKLKAEKSIFLKINQIAQKNKVLLNPNFNIVGVSQNKIIK